MFATCNNNLYYTPNGAVGYGYDPNPPAGYYYFNTLSDWRNFIGGDSESRYGDPYFSDINSDDFHLTNNSLEAIDKNREKIIEEMSDFVAARQSRGKSIPSQAEVFERAVKVVFSDKANSLAAKRTRSSVKKRSSQIIENSTGGKNKTLTPEQEAVKVSNDFDKKLDSEGF